MTITTRNYITKYINKGSNFIIINLIKCLTKKIILFNNQVNIKIIFIENKIEICKFSIYSHFYLDKHRTFRIFL